MLNNDHQRYARHLVLPEIGIQGQQRLKESRVLCVGAGGLGSPALLYLAAAGVGTLGIMDDDRVELSNLQRQVLFATSDVSLKKVEAARTHLLALNPHLNIIAIDHNLTRHNAIETIEAYDLVLDCTDNFTSRYLINDACVTLNKPMVYASILRFEGQCGVFWAPKGPCYRCLYPKPPKNEGAMNCQNAGVVGALAGILGSIQAMEAIKCLLHQGEPLIGRLLLVDALSMRFKDYNIPKHPDCPLCVHKKSFDTLDRFEHHCSAVLPFQWISVQALQQLQQGDSHFLLLDVRDPYEYEICNLGGRLIPLAQLQDHLSELDANQHVIIHCKGCLRSQKAATLLIKHGFHNVSILTGGILAWMDAIDPTMNRY
ncbi:MAG: molybdopterin-synthase adenylyltransferase MoeB [Legionellales bacterium]|nr:molybdopterin-synthase adenylyltransferase MoeB [Legionellales bacterium]